MKIAADRLYLINIHTFIRICLYFIWDSERTHSLLVILKSLSFY